MSIPEIHFKETKRLLKKVHKDTISKWLLEQGYYPEQYVVPPTFRVKKFDLNASPFYVVDTTSIPSKFDPDKFETVTVSYPKTQLTDRSFGIIHPKIYHDIVWYLNNEWKSIIEHLFHKDIKIYSYSFPIPITNKAEGSLGELRAGRMIYEFIEMSEKDLVAEAHDFKFLLRTDIKNFYPSIYTHSIAWALHTKATIRTKGNRADYSKFLGIKLDKLFQYANDGCTNGVPIGPAISDLISEIILAAVDKECSIELAKNGIEFLGVRFKDDYRFLCNSKEDAHKIIKTLQAKMKDYNLALNDNKSNVSELPEGLFREWPAEYNKSSLKYKNKIRYNQLANTMLSTLKIDRQYPDTGVIDKFLSELTTKKYNLKLKLNEKYSQKAFSLLLLLKERRAKSFPHILGIIEKIIEENKSNTDLLNYINIAIEKIIIKKFQNENDNLYDLLWIIYFIKSLGLFTITFPKKPKSELIKSLKTNSLTFFKPLPKGIELFYTIKKSTKNLSLLEHLDLFKK
jgi:hypothetical protein